MDIEIFTLYVVVKNRVYNIVNSILYFHFEISKIWISLGRFWVFQSSCGNKSLYFLKIVLAILVGRSLSSSLTYIVKQEDREILFCYISNHISANFKRVPLCCPDFHTQQHPFD